MLSVSLPRHDRRLPIGSHERSDDEQNDHRQPLGSKSQQPLLRYQVEIRADIPGKMQAKVTINTVTRRKQGKQFHGKGVICYKLGLREPNTFILEQEMSSLYSKHGL